MSQLERRVKSLEEQHREALAPQVEPFIVTPGFIAEVLDHLDTFYQETGFRYDAADRARNEARLRELEGKPLPWGRFSP